MLSDERIRELARNAVTHPNEFAQTRIASVAHSIRLAVAEAVGACKAELAAANEALARVGLPIGAGHVCPSCGRHEADAIYSMAQERVALRAEVERLREDAERLTVLCGMVSQWFMSSEDELGEWYITESLHGETFRDAIDAARKE